MADATGSKLCTTDDVDRLQQTFLFTSTLQDGGLLAGGHLVGLYDDSDTLVFAAGRIKVEASVCTPSARISRQSMIRITSTLVIYLAGWI
jgi:hypothetical protein